MWDICGILSLAFTCGHFLMSQTYKEMPKYLKQSKQLHVSSKKSKFNFSNNSGSRNLSFLLTLMTLTFQ